MKVRRLLPVDDEVIEAVHYYSAIEFEGFPYVVIYATLSDEIVVVAFANTHRRPGYWRERI